MSYVPALAWLRETSFCILLLSYSKLFETSLEAEKYHSVAPSVWEEVRKPEISGTLKNQLNCRR